MGNRHRDAAPVDVGICALGPRSYRAAWRWKEHIFSGGFVVLAIVGMFHIDYRRRETMGSDWGPIALTTSAIPFRAYIQGRTEIDWKGIGIARLVMGIALYTLLLMGHEWAFGVSAMPAG